MYFYALTTNILLQVGYKEKLAVVLFSNKQEAQACARDEDGYGLGEDFKVKRSFIIIWNISLLIFDMLLSVT